MISKMAKPEEVIVVEDENGNIVRETMKDTDVLARYKTMHETLVYLSHLDHEDTENQMLEKLRLQVQNDGTWLIDQYFVTLDIFVYVLVIAFDRHSCIPTFLICVKSLYKRCRD